MHFLDYVKVHLQSGDGGAGCCSFRREKFVPLGGPDGGDGGRGGSIIAETDPNLGTLYDLKLRPSIRAKRGAHGQGANKSGKAADDIVIRLPLGAVLHHKGKQIADLTEPGQRFVICAGGDGGRGNQHFSTPQNRAPRKTEPGWPGEEKTIEIELKQIADVGLVGLPNAGKSTLLTKLTAAQPKIAPYPFTTLHPNLGVMEDDRGEHITLADLPGLIEGASRGEGLGHRFLRHVERTRVLIQLVAFDEEDISYEDMRYQWDLIAEELQAYSDKLAQKERLLVLSKCDLCSKEDQEEIVQQFEEDGLKPIVISSETGEGLESLESWILDNSV